jgi:hypothetical protein
MTPKQIEQVLASLMPQATETVEALVAEVESLIRQGQGEAERRTRDRICAAGYRETAASITAKVGPSLGPPEHRAAEVIIAAGWLPPAEVARRVDEAIAEHDALKFEAFKARVLTDPVALAAYEVARTNLVDEHLAEVERRISGLPTRGPDNSTHHASTIRSVATHIVRDYRQEVRHG